jgi:putative ABC transport system permease protein
VLFAIKHAFRGLFRKKLKNVISTIGILIGVSLLAGVQIATDSLVGAMYDTVSLRYGNADIVIDKGEYQSQFFTQNLYEVLATDPLLAPHIDGIAPRINSQISLSSLFTTKQTEPLVTVIGINHTLDRPFGQLVPDDTIANNDFNFSELTFGQCIVARRLADSVVDYKTTENEKGEEQLALPNSNPVEMSYVDAKGNANVLEALNIKGVAEIQGKGVLNSGITVFMKLQHLKVFYDTMEINKIVVSTTKSNENAKQVVSIIEQQLEMYLGEEAANYNINPQKVEAFEEIRESIKSFRIVLYVFGSLIIISGILLILNITLMNIDERERKIGIMRALGMSQQQLLVMLLTENMILGGIGSLLGIGAGILNGLGIIFLLENFLDIGQILQEVPLIVQPMGLVIAFVIGIILAIAAGIYPAWKASRLDIVDTINEIETPPLKKSSGQWSLMWGIFISTLSIATIVISLSISSSWRWMILIIAVLILLFGLAFIIATFIDKKWAFNGFAIAWMITGLLSVLTFIPYLSAINVPEDKALYSFLVSMLGLVFGTIIFVALNLEWISDRFNELFQKIKKGRAIGIISMRYIGKKKTRSALTFAIFGVILTMNIFLAVFTGSFTLGFDDFAENQQGGVDIVAYSPLTNSSLFGSHENTIQLLESLDFDDDGVVDVEKALGMKFMFSLFGSVTYLEFKSENKTGTIYETLPIPTDMWGINSDFLEMTDYEITEQWEMIDGDPFKATMNSSNNYIILPDLLREFEYDMGNYTYSFNQEVGDIIEIPEQVSGSPIPNIANYTIIAFVDTTSYSMLFSSFLFTGENSSLFSTVKTKNAFLIRTREGLSNDEVVEVSRLVESNLLGFDTLALRNRIEQLMDFAMQAINFMQAFISLGLVVGVLGLIVVSLRGISERTREIGMMQALGFQKAEVITAVVIEIFAVAIVGLLIGIINGFILGYGMYTQYLIDYEFAFIIPWQTLLIFIALTAVLSVIAAVLPARRAAKIPPSEALRYTT